MTEQQNNKKSRRRFLADLLFLGGGVTAAALVAKNQISPWKDSPPMAGSVMLAPPEPQPSPDLSPQSPPMPGEPMPPQNPRSCDPDPNVDGDYSLPTQTVEVESHREPELAGKPVAPQANPNPQGG